MCFASIFSLFSCNKENDSEISYVSISAEEAKALMDSEKNYVIIDARTQEEYDEGHIAGAILMPVAGSRTSA
jgi:rhodanese-related sulfurtransferase